MCGKVWFSSIMCAEVIANHFPSKPVRPRPWTTWVILFSEDFVLSRVFVWLWSCKDWPARKFSTKGYRAKSLQDTACSYVKIGSTPHVLKRVKSLNVSGSTWWRIFAKLLAFCFRLGNNWKRVNYYMRLADCLDFHATCQVYRVYNHICSNF